MTDSVITPSSAVRAGASSVYKNPYIEKERFPAEVGAAAQRTVRSLSRSRSMVYAGAGVRRYGRMLTLPFVIAFAAVSRGLFKAGASEITFVSAMASVLYAIFNGVYNVAESTARFASRTYYLGALRLVRRQVSRLDGMILIFAAVAIIISTSFVSVSLEVFLDGASIGYVRNQAEFESALSNVEAKASELLKRPYKIFPDVSYEFNIIDRRNLLDTASLESHLFRQIDELSYMYVLSVDGEVIGANKSKTDLEDALNKILQRHATGDSNEGLEFMRPVSIEYQLAATDGLTDINKISSILSSNIREKAYYSAVSGDGYETIAANHGMSRSDLLALNPGIDPTRLAVGQELIVNNAISFLPVAVTKTIEYEESIPFETENIESSDIYKGESKVQIKGVDGLQTVTAELRYIDGEEVSRTVIGETVLQEPVTRVLYVGTKIPPPTYPTGTYIRPASGVVTSGYGSRKLGKSYEFHTGVDFANSYGTAIKAVDGGTVSFAGWKGNYGYCVIIDHKNGIQSLYAHNSSLLVKAGQQVAQGATIAKMGSTGRSTGNHCHLEIKVNGQHVNPWNYIK